MINYDKQFEAKMNRIVRNFNAKVKRLEKKGLKYLPEKESVAGLKTNYFERDALKRRLRQLERFSTRGAEDIIELGGGAKATRWEAQTLKSDLTYMKKYYSNRINEYGNIIPTVLGVKQTVSYARMGDAKYENLKVLRKSLDKDISTLDQSDFNRYKGKVRSQIRARNKQKYVFWANYITFLDDVGYKAGIDQDTLERVKDKILNMNIDDFMELYEKEESVLDILDYYKIQKMRAGGFKQKNEDGSGVDEVGNIEKIFQTLDLMIDDDYNLDYSNFK